jgi:hypothetical protein
MSRLTALAAGHPRRVLIVAGIVFLLAAAIGAPVTAVLKGRSHDFQDPHDQTLQTEAAIQKATGQSPNYGLAALVATGSGDVRSDPRTQALVASVARQLATQKGFQRVLDYPSSHLPQLISRDGHETVVLAAFATQEDSAAAADRLRPRLAGAGVRFGGGDVAFSEINSRTSSDLEHAELLAFPILLLLSLWVFRGLIAALMPLLVGGFAIVLTFVWLRLINQFTGLSIFAVNLVTGVGLGLGIDYSLFILSRYREELAGGREPREAIQRTLQTAGRTVLYGCLTVAGALASMLVFPERFLYSMGVGGMLVALMAGTVSLVVLPAVLLALGPRINALAPRWMQRGTARAATPGEECGWARWARAVLRRPGTVALLTTAVLLAIASPALRLALTPADARVLPASSETRQVADVLARDFAVDGSQTITVVLPGVGGARAAGGIGVRGQSGGTSGAGDAGGVAGTGGASAQTRVRALAAQAQRIAGGQAQATPPRPLGKGTWEIDLLPQGSGGSAANQTLVRRLRALVNRGLRRPEGLDRLARAAGARDPRVGDLRLSLPNDGQCTDAADGARDEPAHGGRGRRPFGVDLSGWQFVLTAGLCADRRPGGGQPRAAVRDRLRALHRLRRVPLRPHQGVPRQRPARPRGDRAGPGAHRAADHRRRAALLRGDRRLRQLAHLLRQAARRGRRAGRGDRRHGGARPARARPHGPPRRARLVGTIAPTPAARTHRPARGVGPARGAG